MTERMTGITLCSLCILIVVSASGQLCYAQTRDKPWHVVICSGILQDAQVSKAEARVIDGLSRFFTDKLGIDQEAVDIGALRDVLVAQAQPTGNKFVDFCNSFVRPYFAYSFSFLYFGVKISLGLALYSAGYSTAELSKIIYTPDDQALFWGVVNFFFLDRVVKHMKK